MMFSYFLLNNILNEISSSPTFISALYSLFQTWALSGLALTRGQEIKKHNRNLIFLSPAFLKYK